MSWFNVWDGLKTKTCRYLLQRYLGQFFDNKLNLEQLKVDLYNGKAVVRDVALKVEALNGLLESQGWAMEIVSGHIGCLTVIVPWNALMTNDSSIEVSNLFICLRPVKRQPTGTSMLESMWSSVSSSIQMAEECMNQIDDDLPYEVHSKSIAGLEKFAETIDNVLNRIHAKFANTVLEVELNLPYLERKIAIIININNIDYKNETGCENHNIKPSSERCDIKLNTNLLPSVAKHCIILNGIKMYTREYSASYNKRKQDIYEHLNTDQFAICTEANMIPIAEFKGIQHIEIKAKQTEHCDGPKVSLDIETGPIYALFTPRQIHHLIRIAKSFNEEDSVNKILNETDKAKISFISKVQDRSKMTGVISNIDDWCSDIDKRIDDNIPPSTTDQINLMEESMNSMFSISNTNTTYSKIKNSIVYNETSGEIIKFRIQITSIIGIILHEDIMKEGTNTNDHGECIVDEESFLNLLRFVMNFYSEVDVLKTNLATNIFDIISNKKYLYIKLSPLFINGTEQRNMHILSSKADIAATELDFIEVLDNKMSHIILFDKEENCFGGYHKRPEMMIVFNSSFSCALKSFTCNTINITLERCTLELDISIYDRLSALFGSFPFSDNSAVRTQVAQNDVSNTRLDFCATSVLLKINLRFPIVDVRSMDDPDRIPWWTQNIREDFLVITFLKFTFKWDLHLISILSKEIKAYYCDGNIKNMIQIVNGQLQESDLAKTDDQDLKYPRILIDYSLKKRKDFLFEGNNKYYGSPFSSQNIWRQSDTAKNIYNESGSEDTLLPGETKEIKHFCDTTMETSLIKIKIHIPRLDIAFESKQLYEILYNRLNSDLLLWEVSSPLYKNENMKEKKPIEDVWHLPKSFQKFFFNIDTHKSADSYLNEYRKVKGGRDKNWDNIEESLYQSAKAECPPKKKINSSITSRCGIEICVDQSSVKMLTPVRDSQNLVLPGQSGKFDIRVKNLKVFSVTGYNKNDNLNYVCLQLSDIEVYHCGLLPTNIDVILNLTEEQIEDFMETTFYNLPNLHKNTDNCENRKDVMSLVVEVKKIPEQKIKRLRVTTGINNAILRHNPSLPSYTWLNQLIDFLDVSDFPVMGYDPFSLITEIQIHFWDCAVDYRPKAFDYHAFVDVGQFTFSSNVISSITGCNLRFIAEDCFLSMSPLKSSQTEYPNHKITTLDRTNLVTVLQLGVLDISLLLNEKASGQSSKIDFRSSIHDVHLRTCSDSAKVFAKLIAHIGNDRDVKKDTEAGGNIKANFGGILPNLKAFADSNELEQRHVNLMVAEAVQDIDSTKTNPFYELKDVSDKKEWKLFYFPDESSKQVSHQYENELNEINETDVPDVIDFESSVILNSYCNQPENITCTTHVSTDLGNVYVDKNTTNEQDFCIIQDEVFLNQSGLKHIKVSEDPLRIVDNHFCLPQDQPDLLATPPNFPVPDRRYTLCEMTFTWHLYGGSDFCNNTKKSSNSESPIMSDAYKYGVSQPKIHSSRKTIKTKVDISGGSGRKADVLVEVQFSKIRFSHEVYPEKSGYSSRQVLLISEIEIRDRLQTSEINKFLYHFKSKNLLNKSNEYMLIIKALHMRPHPRETNEEECSLRISVLPIKLNIDQNTLLFLEEFFSNLSKSVQPQTEKQRLSADLTRSQNAPVLSVNEVPESLQDLKTRKIVTQNLEYLINEEAKGLEMEPLKTGAPQIIFFREVIFSPAVPIRLDYHGRRIELSRGPIAGLLMGLAQLQGSGICLRELVNRRGLLGWNKLFSYLCKEWLKDIKRNQLPKILSGLGPTNAVLELFQGIYDLFWLPIEQYQKDGRIIRGFQLGAKSFSARTILAALEITTRFIHLLQFTAETTFDMLSAGPSVRKSRKYKQGKKRHNRPKDIREGVTNAYMIVKEGINNSANNLIETAIVESDQKGYTGAVGAVMRQIPQLVVCPAVLATQATTNILGGAKSSLVPDAKTEAREKWKDDINLID